MGLDDDDAPCSLFDRRLRADIGLEAALT